jgi:mannose-6-phosphate isomerase-like protein (cupin superfamily)
MSYPSDRAAASPSFTAAADVPTLQVGATTARLVATGSLTAGQYGLFRWDMAATSGGASPHLHKTFSEAFYVVEGTVGIFDGTEWREARHGDFLYVLPSGVHAFRNDSGAPASMLILFAPGPPREVYFRELAERIASGRHYSDEERAEFLARHDQYEV